MLVFVLFLIFCTACIFGYAIVPHLYKHATVIQEKREQKYSIQMEQVLTRAEARKMSRLFVFAPLVLSAGLYFLVPAEIRIFAVAFGVVIGLLIPGMYVKSMADRARRKFQFQLVDGLMIMSSSFRGGLSLMQAMEAVVEEMPDPINREFGTVLGENKMGVSLDDALNHLERRMPSVALRQMITAVLLARETGGNLPVIFTRIANNIRENRKIQQNIDTLTIQGKIQGVVMTLLPFAFASIVFSANKQIFLNMFESELGRMMLIYAAISNIIGAFMIWKISSFKDF
ncbi:MAG: type II secretion system F family protein [Candidatus Zapsychrus exili]|nr:type II secretion system F family protein [Candidatus Zapsychrus exili]